MDNLSADWTNFTSKLTGETYNFMWYLQQKLQYVNSGRNSKMK